MSDLSNIITNGLVNAKQRSRNTNRRNLQPSANNVINLRLESNAPQQDYPRHPSLRDVHQPNVQMHPVSERYSNLQNYQTSHDGHQRYFQNQQSSPDSFQANVKCEQSPNNSPQQNFHQPSAGVHDQNVQNHFPDNQSYLQL